MPSDLERIREVLGEDLSEDEVRNLHQLLLQMAASLIESLLEARRKGEIQSP